ncbi:MULTISPECIES: phosphoglucosamine mutase [Geobacillus]|jgi:phosphoglucosamine mutase|uniref:Phosphoglucosamine mutase n=1 Tax=Geobacillus thermodenitrificans (strain NG80-2) TaxID=420246 RepID=GLMM_GEOTN|nr:MULTISPECIES: phosphoglucosamine mutase [Geobacillus]A4IJN4.1 RecName: Full=Phosphoglucosamine mutase [Geobacillus thermodenitrificans NG80-2]ABO65538.1 Phosphoglucosamine mutase [Geobacillus thermodenitrificans NG80-2]MED0664552.1 phosphoglucosamine mutase [Geobacillus thermodenitrificans]MED3718569.1 phosphoglucosamine mutase [Geobacillus thermodenitrificans]MED4918836.1 phosphoglucosamine mutase [Geobacillus thermodenitrificans]OQP08391.1 phosphoglucosamine mutase [Geobacillus sp. 47C-I
MGKYFGTDGVRGVANRELTPELAFKIGRCGGYVLTKSAERPKVLIGRDTRISGHMLEGALVAGLLSIGAEVMRLGVISTPGVAYLTKALGAQAGIMISASHNPVQDNGIKFFGPDGFKLSDEQEQEIETLIDSPEDMLPRPIGSSLGQVNDYFEGGQKYLQYLKQTIDEDFSGMKIALDCAHGATSSLATYLFADLEADVITMGASPNGLNINEGVGSTHPEALAAFVKEKGADVGLAFDGDGDRLIAVDERGNIVDGDQIMYICAKYLKETGRLKQQTVVSTVMSNLGFYKALEAQGISSVQTAVGDRYVVEEMKKNGYNLGGEQSGHIIFLDYNTTGDGMLTALQLVNIMKIKGKPLSELAGEMKKYPQLLVNVRVTDKEKAMEHEQVKKVIAEVEAEMNGNGRVLVRPSGTEPLVRVMAEAPTEEACRTYVERIADVIRREMGVE